MRARRLVSLVALVVALLAPSAADAHVLSFTAAKRTAQARADAYAQQPTQVTTMLRQGSHAYYVQAKWEPPGPYGINEFHAIAMRVVCIGARTRANARRPCTPRAYVTDVFG